MNRYHRPVFSVGASDKKIFLKSASKKRKLFGFFVILLFIGGMVTYTLHTQEQEVSAKSADELSTWSSATKVVTKAFSQVKGFAQSTYQQAAEYYQSHQLQKKQELNFIVKEYSNNENLSKVVFGKSWVGQKLFEKHQLNDFATIKLNRFYQINRNAYILSETQKNQLGEYPILSGPWSQKGTHALTDEDREIMAQGIEILALFNKHPKVSAMLSEINYNSDYGWVLFSTSPGMTVTMGRQGFREKTQRLLRVINQYKDNMATVKSIDLDYSELAIVKLRKGEQHGQS